MTVTEKLLDSVQEIWAGYHTHPCVMGIGDGSLDQEKFRYYMIQDYLYLIDYTRVFAVGVAKAKDLSVMKLFAASTHTILDGEMDIHRAYMKRLGRRRRIRRYLWITVPTPPTCCVPLTRAERQRSWRLFFPAP